ncbi:hypothetical protein LTR94_024288 [Friedmanniomyces endolithicus]|nr:hypothetical protein LTR94_024288 [Friedmanniomyces endolithicus]
MQNSQRRDPYKAAMGAISSLARAGRFIPGESLVVSELAVEVGYSPTPVREALACLAGRGMIERHKGKGYFYPKLAAAELWLICTRRSSFTRSALLRFAKRL